MMFIKISSLKEAIPHKCHLKAKYSSALYSGFSFLIICLACCSCGSTKVVPIETIREHQVHDTIVLHNIQFDSVYVASDHYIDRGRDTILIKDKHIEYRYRLLRDTIFVKQIEIQHDSIPYEVKIVETKEVPRKLTWYDQTARATFWLLIGFILLCLYRRFHKQYARHPLEVTL